MKRILWTLIMATVGCALGYHGSGVSLDVRAIVTGTLWGACIGYGLGSIFDPRSTGKKPVFYWAFSLAFIGAFFSPLVPIRYFPLQVIVAGASGVLLGAIIGLAQLKFSGARQRPGSPASSLRR